MLDQQERITRIPMRTRIASLILLMILTQASLAREFKIAAPILAKEFPHLEASIINAYQSLGHQVTIAYLPAKRSLLTANFDEEFDGELGRIKQAQAELPNLIRIPVSIQKASIIGYTFSDTISVTNIDDLHNYRIGSIRGIVMTDKLLEPFNPNKGNTLIHTMRLLNTNRVDLLIAPDLFKNLMSEQSKQPFRLIKLPFPSVDLYHYINKRHSGLIPDLTKALAFSTGNPVDE